MRRALRKRRVFDFVPSYLKQDLRNCYGENVVSLVSKYGKCAEGVARFKNHVVFNLRCKSSRLIPPSLRIKPPVRTERAAAIAEKASFGFLKERVRVSIQKKQRLEEERKWIAIGLKRQLSDDDFHKVIHMSQRLGEATFVSQRKKTSREVGETESTRSSSKSQQPSTNGGGQSEDAWTGPKLCGQSLLA